MIDPSNVSRRCLNVDDWPEADQVLWRAATSKGSIFEGTGRAALWRAPTLDRTRKGYGRWLSFLASTDQLLEVQHPGDRIKPETVRDYVLCLQEQVAPWTVWSYLMSLWVSARIMSPDMDWEWLYRILAKLKTKRHDTRDKRSRMRPADEIADWASTQLAEIEQTHFHDTQIALAYRNTLMISMLVHCPIRLRNLSMIKIGKHLQYDGVQYRLDFEPDEVKTDRYLTCHIPFELTAMIKRWLEHWRPMLIKNPEEDAFWIGIRGAAMRPRGIYGCIIKKTEDAFGASINPHLFRDIAVSWLVDMDPTTAGVTAPLLGHTNPKTTEQHYIQANQALAVNRYSHSVASLRGELAHVYGDLFHDRRAR